MARCPRILYGLLQRSEQCYKQVQGLYKESPMVFVLIVAVIAVILLTGALFSICLSRFIGAKSTAAADLALVWLFARFVARALLFPGSLKLFQRNTEATFRVEMARQYTLYLRQLACFLHHAAEQTGAMPRSVSVEGVMHGCTVIKHLASSFQVQQQHEVSFNKEQEDMHTVAQDIDRWLASVRVHSGVLGRTPHLRADSVLADSGQAGGPAALADWLRQQAPRFGFPALLGAQLACDAEAAAQNIGKIEQLLAVMEDLRCQKKSMVQNARRFFQIPAVGSLNQLRAELQIRYSGHHCWVRTQGGHRLDAMFLPCSTGGRGPAAPGDEAAALLRGPGRSPPALFSGPTVVWCNPNAAYYETMVYQPTTLNFWLSSGCNLFLFNYAGYGRSTAKPSPARIVDDSESVVKYLKAKGISQIGVYGRSIGGIVACHLARSHPDVVSFVVADRTMSTLENAARYMYGGLAARGLGLTAFRADNVDNFLEARCYKLLICDPKDTMIPDLASLRTAVALRAVERMARETRFPTDAEALGKLSEAWIFFGCLFGICEDDDIDAGPDVGFGQEAPRSGRLSGVAREDPRTPRLGENGEQPPNARSGTNGGASKYVTTQWLEDNRGLVHAAMAHLVDQVHSTLDVVGDHLEGGGVTLNDVFADGAGDPLWALQCVLANLQVWGHYGDEEVEDLDVADQLSGASNSQLYGAGVREFEIGHFLRKDGACYLAPRRLQELESVLAPEIFSTYHRRLARKRLAQVRKEFRQRINSLQHTFAAAAGPSGGQAHDQIDRLLCTVLHQLGEVESFVSSLSSFFKSVDLTLPYSKKQGRAGEPLAEASNLSSDSPGATADPPESFEHVSIAPQPMIDHTATGYLMHVDCGHNGALDSVELRMLGLHLRAARFGRAHTEESWH